MEKTKLQMMEDPSMRFDRVTRLVGPEGMEKLKNSHVMIVGVGGVGSWAAEALARSGIGRLTLLDFDTVCIRNFNRQVQALSGTIGVPKAKVLAERLRLINPEGRFEAINKYFSQETAEELMKEKPDFLIDAIDHVTSKCFLISYCHTHKIPLIVSTGSGGRMDPTMVRVVDLGRTKYDPLAKAIRQILRSKYGFPAKGDYGILSVCSEEDVQKPYEGTELTDCQIGCPQGDNEFQSCTRKSVVLGTTSFVTGAFGFTCASQTLKYLLKN